MPLHFAVQGPSDVTELAELVSRERHAFAAKLRVARAVLGWSQGELAARSGLTQRAVHKLEQGETEPRRTTVYAVETIWREEGLAFEDNGDGGFRVSVRPALLTPNTRQSRRRRAARVQGGITASGYRSAYRG